MIEAENSQGAMALTNSEKARALLRGISSGDLDLAIRFLSPNGFVQHDPFEAGGIAGIREQAARSSGDRRPSVVRILEDGSFVVTHGLDITNDGSDQVFAVFRFENGLVVEHWRFASPCRSPNGSGHTQVDGPTEPTDLANTEANKAMIRDYYETVHIAGRHDRIPDYVSGDRCIRHEPGVVDGVAAFRRDLAVLTRNRTIDEIGMLMGQGDFVFLVARGTHERRPCFYVDLYRVEAGKLVEHWGFPLEAPPANERKNGNGLL